MDSMAWNLRGASLSQADRGMPACAHRTTGSYRRQGWDTRSSFIIQNSIECSILEESHWKPLRMSIGLKPSYYIQMNLSTLWMFPHLFKNDTVGVLTNEDKRSFWPCIHVFMSFKYSDLGLCDVLNICWVDIKVIYFWKLKEWFVMVVEATVWTGLRI